MTHPFSTSAPKAQPARVLPGPDPIFPAMPETGADPASVPGFALAQAWLARHKPGIAAHLAAAADDDDQDAVPLGEFDAAALSDEELAAELEARRPRPAPARPRAKALPRELLLILTLAAAIQNVRGRLPGARGQVALIHGWGGAALLGALTEMCQSSDVAAALLAPGPMPRFVTLEDESTAEKLRAETLRRHARQIEAALMDGAGVVALNIAPADLPPALRRLCALELHLPRPDRARIAALLMLLFRESEPGRVLAALPGDEALARLSLLELVAALHGPTLDAALASLRRLTAPSTATDAGRAQGLDQVAGQPEALAAFRRLVGDIDVWRRGRLAWSAVPRSFILHGPPGTGKTLLAGALAAEARLPLVSTSFGECQKAGHMGDMLAALDAAVGEAISRAPAIFFLDELDGFSTRATEGETRIGSYMRAVITGLLRQLDRLMSAPGVVLIGATNDLAAIDPAIKREGRFDRRLRLDPPDPEGLAQILRQHLGAEAMTQASPPHPDRRLERAVTRAAGRLVGTSGAAAAALARAALARARGDGASGGGQTLHAALLAELEDRYPGLAEAEERRVALHEAGHVLVGLLSGLPDPKAVRLTPDGGAVDWPRRAIVTRARALAELRTLLAGRAAEEVFCHAPSTGAGAGADSDLAQATRLASAMELEYGLGDGGLIWHPALPPGLRAPHWLPAKVQHLLSEAAAEARALITTHRALVEALAAALQRHRCLERETLAPWIRRIRALRPPECQPAPGPDASNRVIALKPE
jgi:cell division protease FtsH